MIDINFPDRLTDSLGASLFEIELPGEIGLNDVRDLDNEANEYKYRTRDSQELFIICKTLAGNAYLQKTDSGDKRQHFFNLYDAAYCFDRAMNVAVDLNLPFTLKRAFEQYKEAYSQAEKIGKTNGLLRKLRKRSEIVKPWAEEVIEEKSPITPPPYVKYDWLRMPISS